MKPAPKAEDPDLLVKIYHLFRDYFRLAERKRRWSIDDDIPWDQCNQSLHGVVADVIETFCSVELFLPDYLSKLLPQVRANRGRAWFVANWGYEECKHSMVLGDWLLKSGHRSEEQLTDLNARVAAREYNLPSDNALGTLCDVMVQELATWVNYCHLRRIAKDQGGDPALDKVLALISIDERAHYDFFLKLVSLYLEYDRAATLEELRRAIYTFNMPAVDLLSDGRQRVATIKSLKIFDEEVFFLEVVQPVLAALGLTKTDLKPRKSKGQKDLSVVPDPCSPCRRMFDPRRANDSTAWLLFEGIEEPTPCLISGCLLLRGSPVLCFCRSSGLGGPSGSCGAIAVRPITIPFCLGQLSF
jgi:acyl-[acyl-carrier-protein] desaturase